MKGSSRRQLTRPIKDGTAGVGTGKAAATRVISVPPPSDYEVREAAWAIVKDSRGMNATGHAAAVRWARAYLGLDEPPR